MSNVGHSLPGPWRTLRAAASLPLRMGLSVTAVAWACAVALVLALVPDKALAQRIVVPVAAAGVAVLWSAWVPRLLLLRMAGDAGLVPGMGASVQRALAAAVLATVLLPAVLLVFAGSAPALVFPAMVAAAAAGMLLALLPAWTWLAACFLPMAAMLLHVIVSRLPPDLQPSVDLGWLFQPPRLAALAAILVMLVVLRWRRVAHRGVQDGTPAWRQPSVLAHRDGSWGRNRSLARSGELPEWFWPAGQTGRAGPGDPVRAIRVLLGTPFAPLTRRQWLLQWGIGALAMVIVALYLVPDTTGTDAGSNVASFLQGFVQGGLAGGLMGIAGVMIGMFGGRLERLVRRASGETSELALLPRLGSAPQARRHLLRAVFGAPARGLVLGTVALLALGLGAGIGPAGLAGIVLACGAVGLLTVQTCLRPLAGLPMLRWWGYLQVGAALLLLVTTLTQAIEGWSAPPAVTALVATLWAAVLLAAALQIRQAWQRILARPHPFLQD